MQNNDEGVVNQIKKYCLRDLKNVFKYLYSTPLTINCCFSTVSSRKNLKIFEISLQGDRLVFTYDFI